MLILLDLDGTLTDTAHENFKRYKDGLDDFAVSSIPLFNGAHEFIRQLVNDGHTPVIVSDSHPRYVNKIAAEVFNISAVSLTDKPNTDKTLKFIGENPSLKTQFLNKDACLMIGDSWLDIELGRRLGISTVLTGFYKASSVEERDGIGQSWKAVKMGPTFYATNYEDIQNIIKNPFLNLLAVEAVFQKVDSEKMVRFMYRKSTEGFIAFRCLARQEDGECDRFSRADKYYQIDNPDRSDEFLKTLAKGISNYLTRVERFPEYHWDYLSYVSDKKTTVPQNKMQEIFDMIISKTPKTKLFEWSEDVEGSLRNKANYKDRREFISRYLQINSSVELQGKNIIVVDDQFTSSATAWEICHQLRAKGVTNILFIALFYLIRPIVSKDCPNCGLPLKIKIKRVEGSKFYSCLPPKFGGNGCGHIENIN